MTDIVERLRRFAKYGAGVSVLIDAAAEIDSLRAQLKQSAEQVERLRSSALDLQYYVNNPSAWDQYDDAMSERIRPVVDAALALPFFIGHIRPAPRPPDGSGGLNQPSGDEQREEI